MNAFEKQYYKLLNETVNKGESDERKKHYSSFSLPNGHIKVNLEKEGFPILIGRKFDVKKSLVEIIGTVRGINNAEWYKERGCGFWKKFGVSQTIVQSINKTDDELVNEFCSYKGIHRPNEPQYMERYKLLRDRSHLEGRKLIDKSDITFWKEIVEIEKGSMGPTHAYLWRNWRKQNGDNFDQLRYVFDQLKNETENQQLTITGVLPTGMEEFHEKYGHVLSLKHNVRFPCHLSHTYCTVIIPYEKRVDLLLKRYPEKTMNEDKYRRFPEIGESVMSKCKIPTHYLDLSWIQKNWDLMLGLPMNIASYAALLLMMARLQNMIPRYLTGFASSMHVYKNHLGGAAELIQRYERKMVPKCKPQLAINLRTNVKFIDEFEPSDFKLLDYNPLSPINFNPIYDKR